MTTDTIPDPALPVPPKESRLGAAALHVAMMPFGMFAAVIAWLIFRKRSAWMHQQARQALNMQLNLAALTVFTKFLEVALRPTTQSATAVTIPQPPSIVFTLLELGYVGWAAYRAYSGAWMPYPKLIPIMKALPEPARVA